MSRFLSSAKKAAGLITNSGGSTPWAYHLSAALGSVRQLTDSTGTVTLTNHYQPYGDLMESYGNGNTSYGFVNHMS